MLRANGIVKFRLKLWNEVLRQASTGPAPVKNNRSNPMGIVVLLKNGGPTETVTFCTAFEMMGKMVPQSTAKTAANKIQLLNRNPLSRETTESSLFSLFK